MNGGLVICKVSYIPLTYLPWKMAKIHGVGLPGDDSRDEVAAMVRVNGSSWQFLNVNAEVCEDLVELVPSGVCRSAFRDGGFKASEVKLLLNE